MTYQADPLYRHDAQQRAQERFAEPPPYYAFPTLEDWEAYMGAHYPCLVDAVRKHVFDKKMRALNARLAALDSLGECAAYARMVLLSWRAAGGGR